jgi:thymidylate synthase (FAD)
VVTKVILLSYTPDLERVCAAAMHSCYSPYPAYELYTYTPGSGRVLEGEKDFFDTDRVRYFLKKAFEMGHYDVFEHGSLTYDIQGVSRTLTHQLVRHRLASFSQQSQRYVKVTRSFGYVKPPKILNDERIRVHVHGQKLDLNFEDIINITNQMEEGYLNLKKSAEDARFIRVGGATTNIVMTANPREYLHIFSLRCAQNAQWEIQDVSYAMLAAAKLIAPTIFSTLPLEKGDDVITQLNKIDEVLRVIRPKFHKAKLGELIEVPLEKLNLHHEIYSYVRVPCTVIDYRL